MSPPTGSPDILCDKTYGEGYLSTTFNDPATIPILFRKWIFGDGTVIEGPGLSTINHTYYAPGKYDVILVAQDVMEQYTVNKEEFIIVTEYRPEPSLIICQSFDPISGGYWRFYFDSFLHLIYENNIEIFRSLEKIVDINKWALVEFHITTKKMMVGTLSNYRKEVKTVRLNNNSPLTPTELKTQILPQSSLKIDELKIWSIEKNLSEYYSQYRGKAGYLDNQI